MSWLSEPLQSYQEGLHPSLGPVALLAVEVDGTGLLPRLPIRIATSARLWNRPISCEIRLKLTQNWLDSYSLGSLIDMTKPTDWQASTV